MSYDRDGEELREAIDAQPPSRPGGEVDELEPTAGPPSEAKVYAAYAVGVTLITIVYAATSGPEWVGVAGLTAVVVFATFLSLWSYRSLHRVQHDIREAESDHAAGGHHGTGLYLPETSAWPPGIALGAALLAAGLAVGPWAALPGAVIVVHAVVGFARQSRAREEH